MIEIKQQKICISMAVVQWLAAAVLYFLSIKFSGFVPVEFVFQCVNVLFIGGLVSILAWRHAVLSWEVYLEKRDTAQNDKKENIFSEEFDFSGRQEKSFKQFNKIFLPLVLLVISGLEFYLSLRMIIGEKIEIKSASGSILILAAVMTAMALMLFLTGKYSSGLAFDERHHFLRPVSGYLLLNSLTLFLAVIVGLIYHFGKPGGLEVFIWASVILSFILALERLLLWVVELYRPKRVNEEYLPVYESRILALFSQPKGVFGNLSAMLEYQFGIRISESLFGVFLKRVFLPFICLQMVTLFLLSSLTYIRPYEMGVKFGLGQKEFEVLGAGLHFNLPWPFSEVERYDVQRIKEIKLIDEVDKTEEGEVKKELVDTWDNERYKQLLAMAVQSDGEGKITPVLAVVDARIKYVIGDVLKYRGAYENSEAALRMMGRQVLSRLLQQSNFSDVLRGGLGKFTQKMRDILSDLAMKDLGVEVVEVELVNFQPPPEVAEFYQAVHKAIQDGESLLIEAEKNGQALVSKSEMEADAMTKKASSESVRRIMLLDAELESFIAQRNAYNKLPKIYETMATMDVVENWLKNVRKVVNLSGAERETIILELKKVGPDLLNLE